MIGFESIKRFVKKLWGLLKPNPPLSASELSPEKLEELDDEIDWPLFY